MSRWRGDPSVSGNVESWQVLADRPASFAPIPDELHPALAAALKKDGIHDLYSHQAVAWEHAACGRNTVLVTGTASGKTLGYNLPVLDRLLRDKDARALYIFPTKALAQDQANNLKALLEKAKQAPAPYPPSLSSPYSPIPLSTYDGDTPSAARPSIRREARLIITNPDMLHTGILPHHTAWAEFFCNLQFVVIDEMHAYRGVFGSHVANVIRRLKRVARFYGARPQFFLTSATIANPDELAGRLIEEPVALVDEDGSARGPRNFLIYNPPIVDRDLGLRRSSLLEGVRLAEDLLTYNVQTILFTRSRRSVEVLLTYLRERAGESLEKPSAAIRGYRSGYLPAERRAIEAGLRSGEVRAVVATNALELGIDIGGMGASVLVGYPGTVAATWQQAGRAGRGADASLSILVATADPLDQFLAAHPEYFFGRSPEQALIDPDNLLILLGHLRCAAFELPFGAGEAFGRVPPDQVAEFLEFLRDEGSLHLSNERYFWMADQYPAQGISLRSASPNNVILQVFNEEGAPPVTIGTVDRESAPWMVHPQAVYLHEGQTYQVEELDLEAGAARLRRASTDYYTEPRNETTVALVEKLAEEPAPGALRSYGELQVTTQVIGYRKVRWHTHEQLGLGELLLPPSELQTTGYWLALYDETVDRLRAAGLWTNDANEYGPLWPRLRQQVRARDSYTCQVCGAAEIDRAHDVHHKAPFRTFTSLEQANQLSNLITLCHACHRRVETAVRVRSGLAGLAYALSHLAPFFLMCDPGDLGVHSDPQSDLAGGQPVVVLYDHAPGGIGFSRRLFEIHDELMLRARELVSGCECADGCPSCVGPGGENGAGGKQETLAILEALAP